jgi:hypothetical protein
VAQDMVQLQSLVNIVMNCREGICCHLNASQEELDEVSI